MNGLTIQYFEQLIHNEHESTCMNMSIMNNTHPDDALG